jgi:ABC-2 type transport system permease protein
MFQSPELQDLLEPTLSDNLAQAKALVDEDKTTAVIYVPAGFTASIIPAAGSTAVADPVQIEFYTNPNRPTTAGVLKTLLEQFISQVEIGRISGELTVSQLLENGLIDVSQAAAVGASAGQELAQSSMKHSSITVNNLTASGEAIEFDILSYMAPGLALMFLMFTVTYGGRSLIAEDRQGTLPRMMVSPTQTALILGGKVFGIFLTAVAQLLILIGGTSLLFSLYWGDTLGMIVLVLAAAFGATGWGMLLAALFKTPGQVSAVGSAVMLIFGLLGGSFFSLSNLPGWVQAFSRITPNAWGLDGFQTLAMGGTLQNVLTPVTVLFGMGAVLFAISSFWFSRRGLSSK